MVRLPVWCWRGLYIVGTVLEFIETSALYKVLNHELNVTQRYRLIRRNDDRNPDPQNGRLCSMGYPPWQSILLSDTNMRHHGLGHNFTGNRMRVVYRTAMDDLKYNSLSKCIRAGRYGCTIYVLGTLRSLVGAKLELIASKARRFGETRALEPRGFGGMLVVELMEFGGIRIVLNTFP